MKRSSILKFGSTVALVFVSMSFQNCGRFMEPGALTASMSSSSNITEQVSQGKLLYTQHCAACHGAVEDSAKRNRTLQQIQSATASVPQMLHIAQSLSGADMKLIALALGYTPGGEPGGVANPYLCEANSDPRPSELRRLSRREYAATLDLLGAGVVSTNSAAFEMDALPADSVSEIFDVQDASLIANHAQAYFNIAEKMGSTMANSTAWVNANVCTSGSMTDACWNNFMRRFGKVAFRRALNAEELTAYRAIYNTEASAGMKQGIFAVISTMLQSPHFLYKVEIGGANVSGRDELLALTEYEVASRLAFAVTGRGPDLALIEMAEANSLKDAALYPQIVQNLFTSNQGRAQVREFYRQWLGVSRMPVSTHSDWFLNGISPSALRSEAITEMDDMASYFTYDTPGNYFDLMTSEKNFVKGPALARVYGVAGPGGSSGLNLKIEAESMTPSTGGASDEGWNLWSNGTLSKTAVLGNGKVFQVTTRMKADLANSIGANYSVRYGTQMIATGTVSSTTYTNVVSTFTTNQENAIVYVEFTNDDIVGGQDRNLYVDFVNFEEQVVAGGSTLTSLPAGQRPGVMSRVGFLMSATNQSSLVHRGLIVRRNLLCNSIGAPSMNADNMDLFKPPTPDPTQSLRTQIETRTNSPSCLGCHSMINPAGFVLENYDGLGRYQTIEKVYTSAGVVQAQHPVNANVDPNIDSQQDPRVEGLKAMADMMSKSSRGPSCLAQQWSTFTKGRKPSSLDNCELSRSLGQLQGSGGGLLSMMKASVMDPNFRLRMRGSVQ